MRTEDSVMTALRELMSRPYPDEVRSLNNEDQMDSSAGAALAPLAALDSMKHQSKNEVEDALAELLNMEAERAGREHEARAAEEAKERSCRQEREKALREESSKRIEKMEEEAAACRAKESAKAAARAAELEHQRQVEAFLHSLPKELQKAFNNVPELQGQLAERLFRLSELLEEATELRMLSVSDVLYSLTRGKRPLSDKEMHITNKEIFTKLAEEIRQIATELVDNVRKLNSLRSPKQ